MNRRRHERGASTPHGRRRNAGQKGPAAQSLMPAGLDAVFGVHAIEALIEQDRVPTLLWVQQGPPEKRLSVLIEEVRQQGGEVVGQPREVLDAIAEGAHQGVIAFCAPLSFESEETLFWRLADRSRNRPPLLLLLDGVTDVHNFGACLRSADAAGVDGVVVTKDRAAPLNATVRKIACGAAESVSVYQVTNLARTMVRLRDAGLWLVGAAGEADKTLYDVDLRIPSVIVMGSEGRGLRRLTREHCDYLVRLPMTGTVESLNVSVATGICLFEAVRQRRTVAG